MAEEDEGDIGIQFPRTVRPAPTPSPRSPVGDEWAERDGLLLEAAEAMVETLRLWAQAYPVDVFPVPPEDQQARDSAVAQVMREMACPQFLVDADLIERLASSLLNAHAVLARSRSVEDGEGVVVLNGRRYRLEQVGRADRPSLSDTFWNVEGGEIEHPTLYLEDDPEAEELGLTVPCDPGWYSPVYRLIPLAPVRSPGTGDRDG